MGSTSYGTGSGTRGQWESWHSFSGHYHPTWTGLAPEQPEAMAGPTTLQSSDFSNVKLITWPRVSDSMLPEAELKCRTITKQNWGIPKSAFWGRCKGHMDDISSFFSVKLLVILLMHILRGAPPTEYDIISAHTVSCCKPLSEAWTRCYLGDRFK